MKYTLKDLARLKGEHVTFLSFTDIPNGKITIMSWSIITPSLDGFPFEKCYCLLPNSVNIYLLPFGLIFIIFCSKKSLWLSGWITTEKFNFFSVYRPVLDQTVYEFVVQLYVEPFKYGMANPDSLPYLNMTDQMLHLVSIIKVPSYRQYFKILAFLESEIS